MTKVQVVHSFATGQRNRAQRFRLVALAVADETPHLAVAVIHQAAILLVLHDARLVDRLYRAEPHRDGGKLPVVRHQPRVRVGRQAVAVDFAAEVIELLFVQPAFEKGARIHARRAVALVKHQVARMTVVGAAEEIVEADVVQRGAGGEGGDVAAQAFVVFVGAHHHGQRIPAHQRANAALHEQIAGHHLFLGRRDGVAERRGDGGRQAQTRSIACLASSISRKEARSGPSYFTTSSRASSHSRVSSGLVSSFIPAMPTRSPGRERNGGTAVAPLNSRLERNCSASKLRATHGLDGTETGRTNPFSFNWELTWPMAYRNRPECIRRRRPLTTGCHRSR